MSSFTGPPRSLACFGAQVLQCDEMTIPCRHPCFSLNSCPPGKNQGGTGQAECDDCVPGTFSTNSSSSFCEDCPGDTSSLGGSTECDRCNKFFYRELEVQGGGCLNCPEGTTCDTDGASTQEKLLIDPGSTALVATCMAESKIQTMTPIFPGLQLCLFILTIL